MTQTHHAKDTGREAFFLLHELRTFIEHEAELLDQRAFESWLSLYADDCMYWVPARHRQEDGKNCVSLFYDDKHILTTRVARLLHPAIHVQDPPSQTVRVLSNFRLDDASADGTHVVTSKFVMIEDRFGSARRFYGGITTHKLRRQGTSFEIAFKKVVLTNCDQSFPALSHPF